MPVTIETGCRHTGLVHRQCSLSLSLSPSLSLHPRCSTQRLLNFLSRPIFPFFCFLPRFHSFTSVLPSPRPPPPPPFSLSPPFIQSDVFTSLSIHSCQPFRHALTSLSLSLSPFITPSACHVFVLVALSLPSSISVYLHFASFNSFHLYPLFLSFFSFLSSVCGYRAVWLSQTQTQTNANRGVL